MRLRAPLASVVGRASLCTQPMIKSLTPYLPLLKMR
jgi:hypothetical protein